MRRLRHGLAALALGLAGCATSPPEPASRPAYIVAEIAVKDPAVFADYAARVRAVVEAHGGLYRIRGPASASLEGAPMQSRFVLIEFPSLAAARAFYASPQYQALQPLRAASADTRAFMIEGAGE